MTNIEKKKSSRIKGMLFLIMTSAMILVFNSCTKDQVIDPIEETVVEEENLDNLNGKWIRIASNNPSADGMIVEMQGTSGRITDKGASNFAIDDLKWQNIKAVAAENFNYEELGSDYNYYTSRMVLGTDDTLRISVGASGAGNDQKWVREGQYTPGNAQDENLDNLNGSWIRIASNNPNADGMIVEMQGTSGQITDKGGSNFAIDDLKWQNIKAVDQENFDYDELGSDYNYYGAKMILRADDTLRISVGSSGAGNEQKWVREGLYTPGDTQGQDTTETLPCNITEARTLTNGSADIDYIINCVLDVTAPLTIEAGVVIQFAENAGIGVYDDGSLTVDGSAIAPVVMRGEEATRGYWRGIHIESNKMANSLNYLQLSDAGGNYVYCCNDTASIYFKDGQASIANTEISNGESYGIIATDSFEFSSYAENTITTHVLSPLKLSLERINELDGPASSYQGNDRNFIVISDTGITRAITIKSADVPYLVENNTVLDIQDRLNIEAGTEIVFEEDAGLGVYDNGILNVIGTASDKVIFRGSEDINGFWRGIHTETNSASNVIRYAELKNAGSNYVYCCNVSAALFIKDGQMTVENTLITQSGGCGIHVNASATFMESENEYSFNDGGNLCN